MKSWELEPKTLRLTQRARGQAETSLRVPALRCAFASLPRYFRARTVGWFMASSNNRWSGPWESSGGASRALGEIVRSRRAGHASGRPLNFTVRRHVIFDSVATLSTHHTPGCRCPCGSADRDRPRCVGQLLFGDTRTLPVAIRCSHGVYFSLHRPGHTSGIFPLSPLRELVFSTILVDDTQGWAQLRPLRPAAVSWRL